MRLQTRSGTLQPGAAPPQRVGRSVYGHGRRGTYVIASAAPPSGPPSAGTPADASATATPASGSSGSGTCPFLASLPTPPKASAPWWKGYLSVTNPAEWQEIAVQGRPVVTGEFLLQPAVLACTGELAREILTGEGDKTGVGWPPHFTRLFGSEALILATGERHRFLRALMQPAFTAEGIANFVPRIAEIAESYLEAWADEEGPVRGYDQLKSFTFDLIVQVVLGKRYGPEEISELSALFNTWVMGLFTVAPFDLPFLPYGKALRAREELGARLRAAISEARAALARGEEPRGILGNMLAARDEAGNGLTDQQCEDNVIVLLFAGHDTSSTSLARILWRLALNPDCWTALRSEQTGLGDVIDAAALRRMPYAEAVVREALRCDNIIGGLPRKAARDFDLGGYRVEAGQTLLVPLTYLTRHDPRWDGAADAKDFDPTRWLAAAAGPAGGAAEAHRSASPAGGGASASWVMPFGAGNRYCIGAPLAFAEMLCFLSLLARGYEFEVEAADQIKWSTIPLAVPKCGLPLRVRRRPKGTAAAAPAAAAAAPAAAATATASAI